MNKVTNYKMIGKLLKRHPRVLEQYVMQKFTDSVNKFYNEMSETEERLGVPISKEVISSAMFNVVLNEKIEYCKKDEIIKICSSKRARRNNEKEENTR